MQITQFVENDEVGAGYVIGQSALLATACLGFQTVHQIGDVEEAATRAIADQGSGYSDGEPVPVPPISTTSR